MKFFEPGMKELYDNAQRKMMKAFEDDQRVFALFKPEAAAPFLNPPASTATPAGKSVNGVGEARVSSETRSILQLAMPLFSLVVSRGRWQMPSSRRCFGPRPYLGAFTRKGNFGFAKVLVPNGEVDQALNHDLVLSGRKLRVEKWRDQPAKAPRSPRAPASFG